jgi:hypothetical protein
MSPGEAVEEALPITVLSVQSGTGLRQHRGQPAQCGAPAPADLPFSLFAQALYRSRQPSTHVDLDQADQFPDLLRRIG